jgi:hypothetical protein
VSPPGGRAGDRGFPASAASRCPDNGSCPDRWNSSITPRIWRPRSRRGGAGWPAGEVLRMNLACRYVQAGVSTAFSTAFSAAAYGLHRPARCGMHVLEPGRLAAGFSPRPLCVVFTSKLEKGPRGSRSDPLSPACRAAGVWPNSQAITNGWRAGRRRPA